MSNLDLYAKELTTEIEKLDSLSKQIVRTLVVTATNREDTIVVFATSYGLVELFSGYDIAIFRDKLAINRTINIIVAALDNDDDINARDYFIAGSRKLPTKGSIIKERVQPTWSITNLGFAMLFMAMVNKEDNIVIKAKVLKALDLTKEIVKSLEERGHSDILRSLFTNDIDGELVIPTGKLIELQKRLSGSELDKVAISFYHTLDNPLTK